MILVTDATAGAAAPLGIYRLGGSELKFKTEPIILNPQTFRPVGSAVTLDQYVRNVMHWYALPLKEAVTWAAENPLKLLNSAKDQTQLSALEQTVWWEEEEEGWKVKASKSGNFFFEV